MAKTISDEGGLEKTTMGAMDKISKATSNYKTQLDSLVKIIKPTAVGGGMENILEGICQKTEKLA
jgi:hypothetical protein